MNFSLLPNLIALTILVAVFRAILRQGTTERLHLWLAGWILVLLHFAAQFPKVGDGTWGRIAAAASLDTLELASIAFLISVSSILAADRRRQILLAAAIALPSLAYTNAVLWNVTAVGFYYGVIGLWLAATSALFFSYYGRLNLYAATVLVLMCGIAGSLAWVVSRGNADWGINFILAALNFVVAILYWRRYRRGTAGVLTAVLGFALWGAVFPTGLLLDLFAPSVRVESEVWNIPKYLVAVGMILTLLENQIEKSKHLAYHDELTGLPNRRLLEDRLERALAQAERGRGKVAVLLLDLDHFKEVNDNFGHRMGDEALQAVVARLASRMRASDTLARSGGDEFTVVSSVPSAQAAEVLVLDLESALAAPLLVQGESVQIGLSVGLALYPDDGRTPDALHAAADQAMYVAKREAHRSRAAVSIFPQASV